MIARRLAIWLLVLLWPLAAGAGELRLEGTFSQGGLVQGQVPPGSRVVYGDRDLRLTDEGLFIFGFGRDAAPKAMLRVVYPDGSEETREILVAQRDYDIQRIDGLPPKQVSPPKEVWERIQREGAEIARARQTDRPAADFLAGFEWPAIGRISGVYGSQRVLNGQPKRPHYGIDIAAPEGTPVKAPADGVVTLAAADHYYTGGTIILDHGHGLSSAFLHLQEVSVTVGQRVAKGEVIGSLGATGRATGPHLDWRINWFKERLDPAFLVEPMPAAASN